MKKRILLFVLTICCLLVLAGCGCEHDWVEANCVSPKTCSLCGETEGEALGHTWADATCTAPKTCTVCSVATGEALGHTWTDATCTDPKTCSACGETEGEALGHTWVEATTEAPKTCTVCGETEGERIITDARFTSAAAEPYVGTWICEMTMSGDDMGLEGFPEFGCAITFNFGNDGTIEIGYQISDIDAFNANMETYMVDTLYATFAESGLDKETADAAMKEAYGMTVTEYAAALVEQMDMEVTFDQLGIQGVYYVDGNTIYAADSWEDEMDGMEVTLEGDTLTIPGEFLDSEEPLVLTRVLYD